MEIIYWNNYSTDGILVKSEILNNALSLRNLIESFIGYNKKVVGISTEGIIVDRNDVFYLETKVFNNESKIQDLVYKTDNTDIDVNRLDNKMRVMDTDMQNLGMWVEDFKKFKLKFEKGDVNGEEITQEFFLLADLMPAEIRKTIKIYKRDGANSIQD